MNMEMAITKLAGAVLSPEEKRKAEGVDTPMVACGLQKQSSRTVPKEEFDYLSVVGSLLHIANCVRCDVAYAVGVLARHAAHPGQSHVRAAKRVLMYLYRTRDLGITYSRDVSKSKKELVMFERGEHPLNNGLNNLQVFSDSDYAADETKRSTTGIVIMLNGGPIAWTSTLGKTVATSTCEAEVNAAVIASKEAIHFQRLLFDLSLAEENEPLTIQEDNAACIAQAKSGLSHVRNAKHYQVKLRFLQQLVVDKQIKFEYCPTDEQLADFFTKPLEGKKFITFRDAILGPR